MVTHTLPMPAPVLPPKDLPPRTYTETPNAADDRFVAAMLETPFCKHVRRNPLDWLVSLVVHVIIISTLLMVPLYYTDTLDLRAFTATYLVGPPPPPPPAPPPAQAIVRAAPKEHFIQSGKLMAPVAIPKEIAMIKEAPVPPDTSGDGVIGGVPGGVPGGQIGGVLGGIIGGTAKAPTAGPAPPPPVRRVVVVGGMVKPPRLIYQPQIAYPPLARGAGVQGEVRIDAIVDEQGNVIQAHVVDGPALLRAAALVEVQTWRYEPTLLDGQPVAVKMIVYVRYHLN